MVKSVLKEKEELEKDNKHIANELANYKNLYVGLKKRFDILLKHRNYCPHKCKYCKEWYQEVLNRTKKIKNKGLRDNLNYIWKTLWLNNCKDFDVIATAFDTKWQQ